MNNQALVEALIKFQDWNDQWPQMKKEITRLQAIEQAAKEFLEAPHQEHLAVRLSVAEMAAVIKLRDMIYE